MKPSPAWLGTGEIRATSEDGVTYAVPSLIVRCVLDHRYSPPSEFVPAMLSQFGDHTARTEPTPGET